jgi:predicted transcriptional regulator
MTAAIRPTTIKIDEDTKARMKRLAEARQRTPHWLILEAIHQYVEREEKREALMRDAREAWREYQETGLHVTFEEADAWLARLEDGEDVEPPTCHV